MSEDCAQLRAMLKFYFVLWSIPSKSEIAREKVMLFKLPKKYQEINEKSF